MKPTPGLAVENPLSRPIHVPHVPDVLWLAAGSKAELHSQPHLATAYSNAYASRLGHRHSMSFFRALVMWPGGSDATWVWAADDGLPVFSLCVCVATPQYAR